MLYEFEVINFVCDELKSKGYTIRQALTTKQQGDDIIAVKGTRELYIESKGATSSDQNSKRYGLAFSKSQVRDHVSAALFKAAEMMSRRTKPHLDIRVGIALPDNDDHRNQIEKIRFVIEQLGIAVFWVKQDGVVRVDSPWEV